MEGITRAVPSPFIVIATQNPFAFGSAGTQRLPEAQVDRFKVSISIGCPDYDSELAIALVRMARASAWLEGRSFVVPEDVSSQFPCVARHRLFPNSAAEMNGTDREKIMADIYRVG